MYNVDLNPFEVFRLRSNGLIRAFAYLICFMFPMISVGDRHVWVRRDEWSERVTFSGGVIEGLVCFICVHRNHICLSSHRI